MTCLKPMYIPAAFRETRLDVLHPLIRAHSFATLVSQVNGELFATHLPFLLDADRGPNGTLVGHMARANPHWHSFQQPAQLESLIMFQGPHAYISPSWYATELSVPTWNYTAIHAYGLPSVLDDPYQVQTLLDATVRTFETGLPNPWTTARLPAEYLLNMSAAIVGFEIPITRLEGKRKLGQNRSAADISGAAAGLRATPDALGHDVADLMDQAFENLRE